VDHRVEEVLDQGATDQEIAEALDIALLMSGSLSAKSVRHAFSVLEQLRARDPRQGGK
jgi:alkylhydroperoxidase/carboxymuconolactone decarboxylase family protein YurZ